MKEKLLETTIKKEQGYLYFVQANEKGNCVMMRAKMERRGSSKK